MSSARAICIFLFTLILFVSLLECRRSHSQYKHNKDAKLKQNRGDRRELARSKGRHSASSPRLIDFSETIDPCACNVPTEIVINEDNYDLSICAMYGCDILQIYSYCYPSNCTWKVINNFTDPNIFFHLYFQYYLRYDSGDFIQVSLPNANVNLRYDWTTSGQFGSTQDYEVFDESFFYVHFETGNPPAIKNGSLNDYYWVMTVDVDYKTCECGNPSVSYFYDPGQEITIYTMSNFIEDQYNYCAPMKCTWKIVNKLADYALQVYSLNLNLRNNSNDYVEIGSSANRLTYLNNSINTVVTIINDTEFNINFVAGNEFISTVGYPPSFELLLYPFYIGGQGSTEVVPPTATIGPGSICQCTQPSEFHVNSLFADYSLMPTIEANYCYPMNCTWKVFNDFPYDNVNVGFFAETLSLRPNSRDYIEAQLPNGTSLFRLTANDNCPGNCTNDYIINAKEFRVNFVTGPPAEYSPPFNLTNGYFLAGFYGYLKQCDCSVPSTYFLNGLSLQSNFAYTLGYDAYCVPMDCSWKIINGKYGENVLTVMPSGISLRNTSEDYIEARNSNGKLLFRIDGTTRNLPSQYNIYDRTFNITFHSSSKVQLNPGVLPSWNLALQLGPQVEPTSAQPTTTTATTIITTTTGMAPTTGMITTNGMASTTGMITTNGMAPTTGMITTNGMTTTTGALTTTTTGMNTTLGMNTTSGNLTTTTTKSGSAKTGILSTFITHVILISLFNFIY